MNKRFLLLSTLVLFLVACQQSEQRQEATTDVSEEQTNTDDFNWNPENFADKKIIRYQIPGFDKLSLDQKKLVYFLTEAGLSGRDIMYDQNYRHNLVIRRAIDQIMTGYEGERTGADWDAFMLYAKNVWFSNGIHHHYSNDKFQPGFSKDYFMNLLESVGASVNDEALNVMFDPELDARKIKQDPTDLVKASAVNFYDPDITEKEVDAFYAAKKETLEDPRVSMGLNSKLVRKEDERLKSGFGKLMECMAMPLKKLSNGWKKQLRLLKMMPRLPHCVY